VGTAVMFHHSLHEKTAPCRDKSRVVSFVSAPSHSP
jgi:hypothetical protein